MNGSKKKTIQIAIGTLLVIALTVWALSHSGISFVKAREALATFGPQAFFGSLLFCSLQILGMILRVKFLFTPPIDPGFRSVAYAISVGQAVNTFFPARAGDVLKAVLFTRTDRPQGPTLLQGAGVLLADRVVDISTLILLVVVSGAYRMSGVKLPTLPALDGFALGFVILLINAALLFGWILRKHLPRIQVWLFQMRDGLAGVLQPKHALLASLAAIFGWYCEVLSLQILSAAQGIPISLSQGVFILVVLNLAIAVPISMANVGAFEGSVIFALTTLGATMEQGLAVATVHHAMQWVAICGWALGMILFVKGRQLVAPAKITP